MGANVNDTNDLAQLAETFILLSRRLQEKDGLLAHLLSMAEIQLTIIVAREVERLASRKVQRKPAQVSTGAGATVTSMTSRSRRRVSASAVV